MIFKKLYKIVLMSCVVIIPLFAYAVVADDNPYNFGIPALDGTTIQLYYQEEASLRGSDKTVNIRIPQDLDDDVLEFNYFWVLIDVRDDARRYFTVEYYVYNSSLVNKTGELLLRETFSLGRGDNEWRDQRFGHMRIDESNFHLFKQTDERRYFIINYLDVEIKFEHLTNPALVEELITRGDFTAAVLFYGFQALIFLTLSLYFSSRIKNRLNTWVKFDFATVALAFSWMIIGFVAIAFAEGLTEYDILRQLIQVPASALLFSFSIIFGMWIPSFFTIPHGKLHIIKYSPEVDITDLIKNYIFGNAIKDPKKLIKVGYEELDVVRTEHGKKYYRNARSLIEIIGCLLHGTTAIKSTSKAFVLEVNLKTKEDYRKTYYERAKFKARELIGELGFYLVESDQKQELLFVEDMRWKKTSVRSDFWGYQILNSFKVATSIFVGVFFATLLILAFVRQTIDVFGFFGFTFGLVYLCYAIYYYTRKYKFLEIDPLSRSALEIIRDSKIASKIEKVSSSAITELINERDQLRADLVDQESARKGEWLVNWEKGLSGKTKITELPQIIEFEKKESKKTNKSKAEDIGVKPKDDEET